MRLLWLTPLLAALCAVRAQAVPVHLLNVWADDPSLLDVQVVHADGAAVDAKAGQDLSESDRLRTGYKSHARLDFAGKATVVVEELSEFKIGVFKLGKTSQVELWLKSGEIQAQVRREAAARTEFAVRTATATASVRGTIINSILYTPQTGMQIAMGHEGSLHATTNNGPTVAVGTNQNAKQDTQDKPFIGDTQLKLDGSRTFVTPVGLDRQERFVANLSPLSPNPTLNVIAGGTSQGPLAPNVLGTTIPGILVVDGGSDPGIVQNLQNAGFSPTLTSDAGVLAGNLNPYVAVMLLKTNVSAYTSQLQSYHDSNHGVLFDGGALFQTFNRPTSTGPVTPLGVASPPPPPPPTLPAYLGGGSPNSGSTPITVTSQGAQLTHGAVPEGTEVQPQPYNPSIASSGAQQILATYSCGDAAMLFNNDGKGRAAFTGVASGSSPQATTLTSALVRTVGGRQ